MGFELRISKFQFARNFSGNFLEIWKFSGICCFGQIATYWVWFPLIFGYWNRFWIQNFKISVFLKYFQKFSRNLEILWISPFGANFSILIIFSTQFCSLSSILSSAIRNFIFRGKFSKIRKFLRMKFWSLYDCYCCEKCSFLSIFTRRNELIGEKEFFPTKLL